MMQADYNNEMKEVLAGLKKREKLLLHTCCAVCAGGVLAREFDYLGNKKRLNDFFDITLYFYNPNIDTREEYDKRAGELEKLKALFPLSDIVISGYEPEKFYTEIKGYEECIEGGSRCDLCIGLRLGKTARHAKQNRFDRFSTVLTVSPHKNTSVINGCCNQISQRFELPYLPADFKKENGFKTAGEVAKELGLYRQNYCGCEYSK